MRGIVSLILIGCAAVSSAQRVKFNDPGLRFSFKKPVSWELFDDGYVSKVSPSVADSATTFLSITYYSPPAPIGDFAEEDLLTLIPASSVAHQYEALPESMKSIRILKQKVKWKSKTHGHIHFRFYRLKYLGQVWELVTAAPVGSQHYQKGSFEKMLKSLKAKVSVWN